MPTGSAHRIISDISAFIGNSDPSTHRILAAGDLNMVYGGTDDGPSAPMSRDGSVFDRMDALGLEFMGPKFPAGRQAHPTHPGAAARYSERAYLPHDPPVPRDRPASA